MESPPFIPSPPSLTSSNDLYFIPQICTNTTTSLPELDLHTIYRSQRSCPYPRPIQMSSNRSINLFNVSPAESLVPLPIPHPLTLHPPAMSPRTMQSTLEANPEINTGLLCTITNGLLTTIANHETDAAIQYQHFTNQIKLLQDCILHYEETFERAPEGYILNDGHVPHFCIPCGNRLSCPAKWIKLNDNGTVSGYLSNNRPSSSPFTIDLYVESNNQYNEEGETKPALPILPWFHYLMVGPSTDFQLLHNNLLLNDDWGLTREVHRYRDLDTQFMDICVKLEQLQVEHNAVQLAHSSCESRLQLACASEQVERLQNIPHKPQASHTMWKRKSSGRGCPI